MTSPILNLTNAGLSLAGNAGFVNILSGISLVVNPAETLALTGPSGSGKSSLLMLMGGLERATEGQVSALGEDLGTLSEDALARFRLKHMGIVFQSFHLIPTLTALENVALPLELAGLPEARAKALQGLENVGLSERAGHFPAQMSGGEQQRVALARALAPKPKILLADEPTGNLDSATGATVSGLIFDLCAAAGTTLVLVTHDTALAARCGRVIRLQGGSLQPEEGQT
ncbi:ABC transporter ATP-binding protein [uncultured Lentibacter sp.]|uniref:ABC transporter ATP-binding protein n=1 Tax=uncultured Lentibacter sp. TaxID=1659309 RepID=UPI00261F7C4E|nr:ATP-binding cassette domain-containing protein [uncultured Lentibacter sp.]